jgi:hypothetical protein
MWLQKLRRYREARLVAIKVMGLLMLHSLFEHDTMCVSYCTHTSDTWQCSRVTFVAQRCFHICCIHISYIEYSWFYVAPFVFDDLLTWCCIPYLSGINDKAYLARLCICTWI